MKPEKKFFSRMNNTIAKPLALENKKENKNIDCWCKEDEQGTTTDLNTRTLIGKDCKLLHDNKFNGLEELDKLCKLQATSDHSRRTRKHE